MEIILLKVDLFHLFLLPLHRILNFIVMDEKEKRFITGLIWLLGGIVVGIIFVLLMLPFIGLIMF